MLNAVLWLPILIFGFEKSALMSIVLYTLCTLVPLIIYLGIKALLKKLLKPENINGQVSNSNAISKADCLPEEFLQLCSITNGKLFIKKCSRLDFYFYATTYCAIFILFSMLALSMSGMLGVLFIIFIGLLLASGWLSTISHLYFPNITIIDFKKGQVDMKNVILPFWTTTFDIGDCANFISIDKSFPIHFTGFHHYCCCDINMKIKNKSYNIIRFSDHNEEKAHQTAKSFAYFLGKGFENKTLVRNNL